MSDRPDENDKSVKDQQRDDTLYDGFRPGGSTEEQSAEQGDTALRNQQEKGLSKEDYRPGEDSDDIRKARSEIEEHFNSRGEPYPTVIDQRTGKPMPFPEGELEKVPREDRAEWDRKARA